MPGFLYFIPTLTKPASADDFKSAGLGYALDGASVTSGPIPAGPDGGPGLIAKASTDDVPALLKPEEQAWQIGPGGKYWVGRWTNQPPPGEAALRKKRAIAGHLVGLGNGEQFVIPVARSIVGGVTLPQSLVLGPNGQDWVLKELPEFVSFCADAQKWWEIIRPGAEDGDINVRMNFDEQMRIAVGALQVNYRIGPAEASLLNLFTTENKWDILQAMVDFPSILAAAADAKKNGLLPVS